MLNKQAQVKQRSQPMLTRHLFFRNQTWTRRTRADAAGRKYRVAERIFFPFVFGPDRLQVVQVVQEADCQEG